MSLLSFLTLLSLLSLLSLFKEDKKVNRDRDTRRTIVPLGVCHG